MAPSLIRVGAVLGRVVNDEAVAQIGVHGAQFLVILIVSVVLWGITEELTTQRPRDEALERYL